MLNISKMFVNDENRINRYIPHIYHKKIKCNKASPFLIENFNKKRINNDYCEYPSYENDFNMAKLNKIFIMNILIINQNQILIKVLK